MHPDISVIICTHNPRERYLRRTLEALRAQKLPFDRWELLLIDNASEKMLSLEWNLGWHPGARHLYESELGLTHARLRGIKEARAELLVFVDDDNVLDHDYLERALAVSSGFSFLGAWSGQCRPEFEEPPQEWTRRYWGNLCIREFDGNSWSNLPRLSETMPCGAGLCLRSDIARYYVELHETGQRKFILDRAGKSLISGGDNDLAACACDLGLGVGLISQLKLTHLIPPERLTEEYLIRLAEGIQFSSLLLNAERGIAPIDNGKLRMILEHLRLLRLSGPDRRLMRAVLRTRKIAFNKISECYPLNRA